jgi:hypothetical protein
MHTKKPGKERDDRFHMNGFEFVKRAQKRKIKK